MASRPGPGSRDAPSSPFRRRGAGLSAPNPSTALARAVVDELARNGVRLVAISPGSRSGALAIAAASHTGLETRVAIDERSAGFFALGRAKSTHRPAAVITTSGTAPANLFPAVIEAEMACAPLVVISADRPAELRGVGANQTIDQIRLFGHHVLEFEDIAAPETGVDRNDEWRSVVSRMAQVADGASGRPGPVHLNIGFREPTVPVTDDGRSRSDPYPFPIAGRPDGGPWERLAPSRSTTSAPEIDGVPRGLVVAGEGAYDRDRLIQVASRLGWPVLATALSGMRGRGVIDSYHHVLAGTLPDHLSPEVVVAVGAVGPSPRIEDLLAMASMRVRIDRWGRRIDPGRNATHVVAADPVAFLEGIEPGSDEGWVTAWHHRADVVRQALREELAAEKTPTGAGVVARLDLVDWGSLVVGSSLPIREVDAHLTRTGRVLANRGASGIDGFVSTALGVASASPSTVAVCGDLTLLHDGNGLLLDSTPDLVLVVLNNGGGGLFDALPQRSHAPDYERLFFTPHRRDLSRFAGFHGLDYVRGDPLDGLGDVLDKMIAAGGVSLIEVPIDRQTELDSRERLDEVARSVLGELDP